MTTEDELPTMEESLESLEDVNGQSYVRADDAAELLFPFALQADAEWVAKVNDIDRDRNDLGSNPELGRLAFAERVADEQRASRDTRGIVTTYPHQMLVTYSDVSAILVEALGGEPSGVTYGGAGFTADARHDENVERAARLLEEEGPAGQ